MRASIQTLFRRPERALPAAPSRERRTLAASRPVYAVGDVHGCLGLLSEMETVIDRDAAAFGVKPIIVLLGDLVDRGPQSAQVLDHVEARVAADPSGYLCLAGNHEQYMLEFLDRPSLDHPWLDNGGWETLLSYGIAEPDLRRSRNAASTIGSHIPPRHVDFLRGLPVAAVLPDYFLCHAGIRPGIALESQSDEDLQWIRDGGTKSYEGCTRTVVHGHQPQPEAVVLPRRINVDTGAYATGRLSAVRLGAGEPFVLSVSTRGQARYRMHDENAHG